MDLHGLQPAVGASDAIRREDSQVHGWEERRPGFIQRRLTLNGIPFIQTKIDCQDCGHRDHQCILDYVVVDEVWQQVADPLDGILCLSCLEDRLGRGIREEDLKDIPVNRTLRRGIEIGKGP